ncbi:MAG: hypothetical protein ACRENE_32460 [Polyangiaceae bacterium]
MSAIVDAAIAGAGLSELLEARRAGRSSADDVALLRRVDLLALGACADRVRAEEVGPEVVIRTYGDDDGAELPGHRFPADGAELTGLELLREVAIARVTGAPGARIAVDWTACGLELAQVALGFGADELRGRIADKRGLPFADGELLGVGKKSRLEPAAIAKEKEIAGFVVRAGRTPVFARRHDASPPARAGSPQEVP